MKNKFKAIWSLIIAPAWIVITNKEASFYLDFDNLAVRLQLQALESMRANMGETIKALKEELDK